MFGSAYGTRTRAPALRGPCPNRLDERAKYEPVVYRGRAETQAVENFSTANGVGFRTAGDHIDRRPFKAHFKEQVLEHFGPPVQLHNAERLATGWLAE